MRERLYAPAVFHCQQAVEKLLKAIWVRNRQEVPPRTHNLGDLAKVLGSFDEVHRRFLADLSIQAVATRYAGQGIYTGPVAEGYLRKTEETCEQLLQLLR